MLVGCREVDRDAVGDGDGEQKAPGPRRMPVHAVDNQPPVAGRWMPAHRGPVHLVRQDHAGEARADRGANGAPARHHLADVLFAPQAEGEAMPAGRDPGNEAVAGGPFLKLHPENARVGDGLLAQQRRWRAVEGGGGRYRHRVPSARSIPAPRARSRSSIRSYPRSIWPMLWITESLWAASAASNIAIPARMSGLSTTPPWSGEGPAITARCGSHSTMRAPIPMSLSTKKSRDSNSFSNTSRIPSHCDATTIAIDIRSAGEGGPRPAPPLRPRPPRAGRVGGSLPGSTIKIEKGREAWGGREEISGVAGSFKKKKKKDMRTRRTVDNE